MFAVIKTGGKQYKVESGQTLLVEKLAGNAGDTITFDSVLIAGGEGAPDSVAKGSVDGLTVAMQVIDQVKGDKVIIFKKTRRHTYRRKNGHRQQLTLLRVMEIAQNGKTLSKMEPKAAKPAKEEAAASVMAEKAPAKKAVAPKAENSAPAEAPKKAAAKKPAAKKSAE